MQQKFFKYFASEFLLLALLLLECLPLPRETAEGWQMKQSGNHAQPSLAHSYLLRSPEGTLIGWGYHLRSHEYAGLPLSSYYFRKKLATDVVDMTCSSKNLMYIDQHQNIHGVGRTGSVLRISDSPPEESEILTNDHIAEDVQSIAVGNSHAAAVTTNGTLYMWGKEAGSTGDVEPYALMEQVKRVQIISGMTFIFTRNHNLYWYPDWGQDEPPELLAQNVNEIALLSLDAIDTGDVLLQCLRTDGSVFCLHPADPERTINLPYIDRVRSLCQQGLVKEDDSLWRWKIEDTQPELVKERDGVLSAVDMDHFITTSGHIHLRDHSTFSLPVVHSLRMSYPGMRNLEMILIVLSGALLILGKRNKRS